MVSWREGKKRLQLLKKPNKSAARLMTEWGLSEWRLRVFGSTTVGPGETFPAEIVPVFLAHLGFDPLPLIRGKPHLCLPLPVED